MFRQFARLPLRRCLHSQAGASPRPFARYTRSAYAVGASITVAGYLAWSWSSNSRHLSLDSETVSSTFFCSPTGVLDLTVHVPLAPKKHPASSKPPGPSDASTPSAPQSDASQQVRIPPESEEPSLEPQETSIEGEAAQEDASSAAFDPVTGAINWDCPCLGGMAYGPCGQQFREAFSCFVYSEADPKGIDCVEKFKAMQDCFREHPDVYGDGMWIYP